MLWIRSTGFNTDQDPDQAFYLNADPDPEAKPMRINADPDLGKTLPSLEVEFLHEKCTLNR